jgi:predicted esterase
MKNTACLIILLFTFYANAQEGYSELTEKAITIVNTKDSINYKSALNLFEKAFTKYPDSINGTGYYFASIVAADVKQTDKAFKYLSALAKLEADEEGYPGWSFVLDEYAKEDYKNLLNDTRWDSLVQMASINKENYFKALHAAEKEFFSTSNQQPNSKIDAKELYHTLKKFNPYLKKEKQDYSISFQINDTTKTSYHVHLPENYNPKKAYAVLLFLHGAVRYSTLKEYQITQQNLAGWNRYYTKYASLNDVILVFPSGNEEYNWMTSDAGFFMIPKIVKHLKTAINVDDNKIFLSGHSNGASGSFSYLMKEPTPFAGFYGFNTHPKVYTGGTFIENSLNRSFINFSTDQDYYYPPNANDSLNQLMNSLHADYKEYRYAGFPHWFPQFDESEPAYKILFESITKKERNPFPTKINWEFDDNNYGTIDWISNAKLDTIKQKAIWHQPLNFKIDKWLAYDKNDSLITKTVNKSAFDFPRKSGKIIASYHDNVFQIKTSHIESFQITISPEMINLKKKIKIYVNDKIYFNEKPDYNQEFMLQNFEKNKDRKQIWINSISIHL